VWGDFAHEVVAGSSTGDGSLHMVKLLQNAMHDALLLNGLNHNHAENPGTCDLVWWIATEVESRFRCFPSTEQAHADLQDALRYGH